MALAVLRPWRSEVGPRLPFRLEVVLVVVEGDTSTLPGVALSRLSGLERVSVVGMDEFEYSRLTSRGK